MTDNDPRFPEVTEEEKNGLHFVLDSLTSPGAHEVALIRALLDGQPVAVLAHVATRLDGQFSAQPLAILFSKELAERIETPHGISRVPGQPPSLN